MRALAHIQICRHRCKGMLGLNNIPGPQMTMRILSRCVGNVGHPLLTFMEAERILEDYFTFSGKLSVRFQNCWTFGL